ncbi:hypothetical protein FA13DRAFT_562449 [Coprinellus micaceus]|uniref:Uncharacterized protein n=1 Tax=Coprinellus micaceus TaxID=71717 RepID=A0A4Y7SAR5_COPMI|nr:hypothetical protein FA13DRAFT_562449 [Coprinellus micaceus]
MYVGYVLKHSQCRPTQPEATHCTPLAHSSLLCDPLIRTRSIGSTNSISRLVGEWLHEYQYLRLCLEILSRFESSGALSGSIYEYTILICNHAL